MSALHTRQAQPSGLADVLCIDAAALRHRGRFDLDQNLIAKNAMHYLMQAEAADGYPNLDYEDWYQLGLQCFHAQLPKATRRQAFVAQLNRWKVKGRPIHFWQARAFVYGTSGRSATGTLAPRVDPTYQWPAPPDPSWLLVVCSYPDGTCELDLVHQVSRRFWSEDNEFFAPPLEGTTFFNRDWYIKFGFDVIDFDPDLIVAIGDNQPHLKLVV